MRLIYASLLLALLTLAACGTPTATQPQSDAGGAVTSSAPVAAAPYNPEASAEVSDVIMRNNKYTSAPEMTIDQNKTYTATIETSKGTLTAELFPADAPMAVNNFVFLARDGFYNGVKFHRIIQNFMVQTGDPTATGRGGPGYTFAEEPVTREYVRGTLAMARTPQPSSQGSQFFIVHQDYPLPKEYTIFGQVTEGLDVLDAIAATPVIADPNSGEPSLPTEDVLITNLTITEQ